MVFGYVGYFIDGLVSFCLLRGTYDIDYNKYIVSIRIPFIGACLHWWANMLSHPDMPTSMKHFEDHIDFHTLIIPLSLISHLSTSISQFTI